MIDVSVDDRRALWALTTRHLRSDTYGAVLLAKNALRARAGAIDVATRGDRVIVTDDGAARADELRALAAVLRDPAVSALHHLEARYGTDLLVALATAESGSAESGGVRIDVDHGRVTAFVDIDHARTTRVTLARPATVRDAERAELRAWLPAPRARVRIDGRAIGRATLEVPRHAFFSRAFAVDDIRGVIGFALGESTSRVTVLQRGLWVAEDAHTASLPGSRGQTLPVVAVYDDDGVSDIDTAVARARVTVDRAAQHLTAELAARFPHLPRRTQRVVRSLLLRMPTLPPAFHETPLFEGERGRLTHSLRGLQGAGHVVIGRKNADVIVDDVAAAFLRRALGNRVQEALPPPRRRLRAWWRSLGR